MTQALDTGGAPLPQAKPRFSPLRSLARWFDSWAQVTHDGDGGIDWLRAVPFLALHVGCLAVIWVGWSWPALRCTL